MDLRAPQARVRAFAVGLVITLGLLGPLAGTASAQDPVASPTFTDPVAQEHLSVGLDDSDDASAGFQYTITGTAPPDSTVEITGTGPGTAELGTTTADGSGNWSLDGSFDTPGQWQLSATATSGDQTSDPTQITVYIVLRYVFTWYDDLNSSGNWVLVANPGTETARAEIFIDGVQRGDTLTLAPGEVKTPKFNDVVGGPVVVDSLDGYPLITTQRTTWRSGDLEEVAGVYDGSLSDESWFSWYDTRNTSNRDWVVVTNFGDAATDVTVEVGTSSLGTQNVAPGESATFRKIDTVGGAVHVTASQPVLASRRTLWTSSNFVEVTSTPDRWLSQAYAFTWFDAVGTGNKDWIMVANPSDQPVDVEVGLAGSDPSIFELGANAVVTRQFPGARGGPVWVAAEAPVIVTQRALWSSSSSFEESAGVAVEDITSTWWQSWYDDKNAKAEWLMQASIFPADQEGAPDTNYTVSASCIDHSSTLAPGDVETPRFNDEICGPVEIASEGTPFLQSKRTLWGAKNDFMELNGIRGTQVSARLIQAAAPADVTVSDAPNDDGTAVQVSWTESGDAAVDGYWVYRDGRRMAYVASSMCADGTCATGEDGLTPGVEVTYEVRALAGATVEGAPGTGSGTPVDDAPTAPTWPNGTTPGDEAVHLDWNDNPESDVVGYHVYYVEDPSQPGDPVDDSSACDGNLANTAPAFPGDYTKANTENDGAAVPQSAYTVTGLTNGTRYCFIVTAVDTIANESGPSDTRNGTPGPLPPETTVDSPNGGEVFGGGDTITVAYTATDPNEDWARTLVEYTLNASAGTPVWNTACDQVEPTGTCDFTAPEQDTSDASVRVTVTDEKGQQAQDASDAAFSIDTAAPDPIVNAPTGADSFTGGDTVTIEYDSREDNPAAGGVDMFYRLDGGEFVAIDSCTDVDDTGSCDWTAPDIDSSQVVIKVEVTDELGRTGSALSEAFTVATPPAVPTGLTAGPGDGSMPLSWTANSEPDLAGYFVYHRQDPQPNPALPSQCGDPALSTYNKNGSEPVEGTSYTVPGLTNDTRYCFRISAVDTFGSESGPTDPVAATPEAQAPAPTVSAPTVDQVFRGDACDAEATAGCTETTTITYEANDPDDNFFFAKLEYTTDTGDSANWVTIEDFSTTEGTYEWNPPALNSDTVRVRVTVHDERSNSASGVSPTFTVDSADPQLTSFDSPVAGEAVQGGSILDVIVNYHEPNLGDETVELSLDGGTTWSAATCGEFDDGAGNTFSCKLEVPSADTAQANVRVTMSDTAYHAASLVSPTFEIDSTAPGTPVITQLAGVAVDASDPAPHAVGQDRSPETVVAGGSPFTEDGTVKVYLGTRPSSCAADIPDNQRGAETDVTAGAAEVIFNVDATVDFEMPSEGVNSMWVCMIDTAGNMSPVTAVAERISYEWDTTPPNQVTGLSAASGAPGTVDLTWSSGTGDVIAGYVVYRADDPAADLPADGCATVDEADYTALERDPETGLTTTSTSYTATGLQHGQRYCFQVSAVDDAGNEGQRSDPEAGTAGSTS